MLVHYKNIFCLLALATFSMSSFSTEVNIDPKVIERVKENISKFKIPETINNKANNLKEHVNSEEYLAKKASYEQQIRSMFNIETPELESEGEGKQKGVSLDRFILFISASLPMETLRRYAKDVSKYNGLMVLRGVVGDDDSKLIPTIQFMEQVLRKDSECEGFSCEFIKANVTIDPRLFSLYDIKQVPALVFVKNMSMTSYVNQKNESSMPKSSKYKVYGDASLKALAQELHRISKNKGITKLLKTSS